MATFVSTFRFSEKGLQSIRDSAKRASAFKAAAEKMNVRLTNIYWTLGPFDGLVIFTAPDDQTATAAMLALATQGNVHTSTSRAFDAGEFEKVIDLIGN